MVDKININGVNNQSQAGGPDPKRATAQEKIVIDFKALDQDGDLHVTVDEVLRHQIEVYNKTGKLPEGKTIAEFLMDIQNAVEKYAGDDKQLNIDEYGAVVKTGIAMSRPSEESYDDKVDGENPKEDNAPNLSQPTEPSIANGRTARAEANKQQIDEVNAMKVQAWVNDAHKQVDAQRAEVINAIVNDQNLTEEQKNNIIAAQEATFAAMHQDIESKAQEQLAIDTAINAAAEVGYQAGFNAGLQAGAQISQSQQMASTEDIAQNKPDKFY